MGHSDLVFPEPSRHRLTIDEFATLCDAGFFRGKGRFELIEGDIFQMSPLHRPHARMLMTIGHRLMLAIEAAGLDLEVLSPVSMRLGEHSLPEPDLAVASPDPGARYVEQAHVRLAIEIAAASRGCDLGRKAELYARYDVPEYWVFDLEAACVVQMTEPAGSRFGAVERHAFGARIRARTVPAILVDTASLA